MHPTTPTRVSPGLPQITHAFFDAEGTLWEPRAGRTIYDFWDDPSRVMAQRVFQRTPGIESTLATLHQRGFTLAVMSKHDPNLLPALIADFGLESYFEEILVGEAKGQLVADWLSDLDVHPEQAVMIGDRVDADILPLADEGVIGILLDRTHNRGPGFLRIRRIKDVVPTIRFLNALRSQEQQTLEDASCL